MDQQIDWISLLMCYFICWYLSCPHRRLIFRLRSVSISAPVLASMSLARIHSMRVHTFNVRRNDALKSPKSEQHSWQLQSQQQLQRQPKPRKHLQQHQMRRLPRQCTHQWLRPVFGRHRVDRRHRDIFATIVVRVVIGSSYVQPPHI